MKSAKIKFLLTVLLGGGITLTSCKQNSLSSRLPSNTPNGTSISTPTNTPAKEVEPIESATPEPPNESSSPFGVTLSPEAEEISLLLDKGSYNAAETLFNSYISLNPNDATLYCQYVRFLIEGYDIAEDPFIRNPIKTDDEYKSSFILGRAIVLASEFDPKVKPYLADIILESLYDQIYKKSVAGEGYVNSTQEIIGGGFFPTTNKIYFAWQAIELDSTIGKIWTEKYESLVPVFVRLGMPTSAMWTANLSGDLSNGADKNSDVDFERATQGFLDALESRKCKVAKINDSSTIYATTFAAEIKRAHSNRYQNYFKLVNAIKREGGDLKVFEDKGVLPPSLLSNSNSANSSQADTINQNSN